VPTNSVIGTLVGLLRPLHWGEKLPLLFLRMADRFFYVQIDRIEEKSKRNKNW